MKKILNLFLSILALTLFLASCNKELDLKPTDSIDATKAFNSLADLRKGVLGVYATNSDMNRIYIGSILADEAKISFENRGQGQFEFKWQYSATESSQNADFGQYYEMIDNLHRVLAAVDGVPALNAAEESEKTKIKAELIALRGVAHFELITRFMPSGYDAGALGVPIMLKSDLLGKPTRNTVGEVMAQIEADLQTGRDESLIPDASPDYLSISHAAIAAYQARAALLRKDWAKAASYATEAITLSGATIISFDNYPYYWQDADETETIWKFRNNTAPQLLWRDNNGDVFFEPSDKLKNMYDKDYDIRFFTFFSADGNDTSIVIKYPGGPVAPQVNDLKLIRVSEMYLIRAEAYAESNNLDGAAADYNELRRQRVYDYTDESFVSTEDAVNKIMAERARELCFEGFRFFDLKRRGLPVNRDASDVQSAAWQNLPASDFKWALPIPQDEIFANKNMVQNPGY